MRALVIGGTGFIGSWIVRQLLEGNHEVAVLHRGRVTAGELPRGAISLLSDGPLSEAETYEAALRRYGEPDAVIHVLAMAKADAEAAVAALTGRTARAVVLSSGDVYRAYGRFIGLEPGPPDAVPLDAATSPLRERLYPYRAPSSAPGSLLHDYEKILVEQVFRSAAKLPSVVLRLPKVYGPGGDADLATMYGFAAHPAWRWTHGYVENVAAAAVLAAHHPAAAGRVYNVGEAVTPTVRERIARLPPREPALLNTTAYDFRQDLAFDTTPIRAELGYAEPVPYEEAVRRTLVSAA